MLSPLSNTVPHTAASASGTCTEPSSTHTSLGCGTGENESCAKDDHATKAAAANIMFENSKCASVEKCSGETEEGREGKDEQTHSKSDGRTPTECRIDNVTKGNGSTQKGKMSAETNVEQRKPGIKDAQGSTSKAHPMDDGRTTELGLKTRSSGGPEKERDEGANRTRDSIDAVAREIVGKHSQGDDLKKESKKRESSAKACDTDSEPRGTESKGINGDMIEGGELQRLAPKRKASPLSGRELKRAVADTRDRESERPFAAAATETA